MANFSGVIAELRQERNRAAGQVERLDQIITVLTSLNGASSATMPPNTRARRRKTLSAAARHRIAAAQRARWAKLKSSGSSKSVPSAKGQPSAPKKATVRILSPAVRKKMAVAQRARWAKVRAGQPKGKAA